VLITICIFVMIVCLQTKLHQFGLSNGVDEEDNPVVMVVHLKS